VSEPALVFTFCAYGPFKFYYATITAPLQEAGHAAALPADLG
jgi:hypothetical protein